MSNRSPITGMFTGTWGLEGLKIGLGEIVAAAEREEGESRLLAQRPHPLPARLSEEVFRNWAFVDTLAAEPLWNLYLASPVPAASKKQT
jgi:hypothetical protein